LLEAFLDVLEADELDRFHDAEIVAMMAVVSIVVADDTAVPLVEVVVDVGEVVTGHLAARFIYPDFPT
jgi:hypothetical protein